ncbi:MAG: hypothetical protein IJK71_02590 [Clostridia bacterium]|nr:hypothetical protein [Clostridia bacterium]
MKDLYSENDLLSLSSQLKKRYTLLGVILAVIMGLFVYSMIIRVEWLSVVLFALFCSVAIFFIELFCMPLHRYKKLIQSALKGRTHTETLVYDHEEAEPSLVDGVLCSGLILLGEPDKHGIREHRYYWDKEIPCPAFNSGDQITIKYTGKNIIGYEL